ncbi:tRNA wybutosine-synthesizing protein 2 like protein [Argiope bruennichi]|uniref:tRNA(Phe) (4-demethylwyosine(37)-C(7)) aminocarboxypropyltransferase n=1 Tax=Argiope bruennichi TaxID=94029 RepID=A0A8T0FSE1_ARGBR|nr:tRNA wybutosine-synthesizing protein 2 like protein [Argiope bruennichi]
MTKERKKCLSPYVNLKNKLLNEIEKLKLDKNLLDDIPSKWEKHGDLVLLPASSFQNKLWSLLGGRLWDIVSEALKCQRVARKYTITNDNFRSPQVEILKGCDGWVLHIDNKIKYKYDITKCMFSAGNISEKLRIAQLSCKGETVVDLYAGIGYFTLPFLVHAKASLVHACEWNPHAVEALSKNLRLNGVKDQCIIHYGDNREVCPINVADRVNLGLIPSSERGWETACKALKLSGGVLHVHGNVTSNLHPVQYDAGEKISCPQVKPEWTVWSDYVCERMKNIFKLLYSSDWMVTVMNITRIKSYAPHIDHLVVDICCKPSENGKDLRNNINI